MSDYRNRLVYLPERLRNMEDINKELGRRRRAAWAAIGVLKITLLLRVLDYHALPQKALENAAAIIARLTRISKQVTHLIVNQDGVNILKNAALLGMSELREQCMRALGNIALDCSDCLQKCNEAELLDSIAVILAQRSYALNEVSFTVWCANAITHGGVQSENVSIATITLLTGSLIKLLKDFAESPDDAENCLQILLSIADDVDPGPQIEVVLIEPGLAELLIEILNSSVEELHFAALHMLGYIIASDDHHREAVISWHQLLPILIVGDRLRQQSKSSDSIRHVIEGFSSTISRTA
ncbi:hypothetical protein KIN20_015869 [Parelaphostrongylus tenuis]|uniref:Uncharacterized protein n=1 Tax=Parelaphostrongylus tenuis TaxID=148309 RepID=A0AAD5MKE8_PARTN|nr:hypothetical protein KIN20_015869 [Parelaphostrongylus tenuis]